MTIEENLTPPLPSDIALSSDFITRESLYEQAWSTPMTKIAARYGVSSSYLARVFTELNVPRPPVGYWAQVAVGKGKPRPALTAANPGERIAWARNGALPRLSTERPKAPKKDAQRRPRRNILLPTQHPLLVDIAEYFKKVHESDEGYLRPTKRSMADLIVSRSGLGHAVDFANQLYLALTKKGSPVTLASADASLNREAVDHREQATTRHIRSSLWQPQRPTVAHIGTVVFGLTIYEISEYVQVKSQDKGYVRISSLPLDKRRSPYPDGWMMSADMPSGRLCLQAYSPYYRVEWLRRWTEEQPGDLVKKIPGIVKVLHEEAPDVANKLETELKRREIEQREREIQWAEWKRQEDEKRRLKLVKDSQDQLEAVIQAWAKVNNIRAFFDDIERSSTKLGDEERAAVLERLNKARELIGDLDALKQFKRWEPPT